MSDELTQRKAAVKEKVKRVLELCDPDKVDKIQMLLNKFEGRERELFQKLEDTYSAHENYPKCSLRLDPEVEGILSGVEAARAASTPVIHTTAAPADAAASKATTPPQNTTPPTAATALPAATAPPTTATAPLTTAASPPAPATTAPPAAATATVSVAASHNQTAEKVAEKKQAEPEKSSGSAATAGGELVIRTCMFTGCRRARTTQYLCHVHSQLKPRPDGLLALVLSRALERHTTMTVVWEIQMLVLPSNTKYGQKITEPLLTLSRLRFSDLQALYKKIKAIHKAKPGYHDDLKELPKFASKHELSTAGKFFGSNEVYNDDFLNQRQAELQTWLDKILDAPKIKFIPEFWNALGLRCVDGEYLEKDTIKK